MSKWKILSDWETKAGLRAVTILDSLGTINGYVEVLPKSKYYDMEYNKWDMSIDEVEDWSKDKIKVQKYINNIEVHGGLTFGKMGNTKYMPSNNYWFGFDCNHIWDKPDYNLALEHFPEEKESIDKYFDIMRPFSCDAQFRDQQYVEDQCERLAEQLKGLV